MTHIEGENVGIFCSVRNIYRLYVRTYCVPGILKELKNGLRCVFSVTRSRDPHSKKIRVPREPAATSLRVRRSDGTYTARFITKILSSSSRRRFYPQRAPGQAVVTGVVPSPPRYVPSIYIAHSFQHSHCSSIFIECC